MICLEGKKCVSLSGYTKENECLNLDLIQQPHTQTHSKGLLLKVNLYREQRIADVLNFEETEIVCLGGFRDGYYWVFITQFDCLFIFSKCSFVKLQNVFRTRSLV